ncbi:MAG: diguanylate cyclase [Epsilonproteobacteria bacterium]|nr:diguanylate cyclase [Campylobacterota bacterium]
MLEEKIKFLETKAFLANSLQEMVELNHSFLTMLFDTIPNPIFYKDKNGIYQHCNDAFSKTILGISKKDIIGKSLYDFPDEIPKELADIYNQKDQELFINTGTQYYEGKVQCFDKVVRDYKFYKATFVAENGEVQGIVGTMLDVSEYNKILEELKIKNDALDKLSITDPLTQLYNRRYFNGILKDKISLLTRNDQVFAFMFIDIDFFKNYNDTFGHKKGDIALEDVAHTIQSFALRPTDYAFRIGGEEFCILFNVSEIDKATEFAKKLIKKVEDLKIQAAPNGISKFLTVSAGLCVFKDIICDENCANKAFEKVDKLLYTSKQNGRNQITCEINV